MDGSLANFFRLGDLGALREFALLWVADRVEDSLQRYVVQQGIASSWETRERVLVGSPGRQVATISSVERRDRSSNEGRSRRVACRGRRWARCSRTSFLAHDKRLLEELGGSWHEMVASDVPSALVEFATTLHATQIVLGTSRRSRWTEFMRGSIINRVVREAKGIDVHVIATERLHAWATPFDGTPRLRSSATAITGRVHARHRGDRRACHARVAQLGPRSPPHRTHDVEPRVS